MQTFAPYAAVTHFKAEDVYNFNKMFNDFKDVTYPMLSKYHSILITQNINTKQKVPQMLGHSWKDKQPFYKPVFDRKSVNIPDIFQHVSKNQRLFNNPVLIHVKGGTAHEFALTSWEMSKLVSKKLETLKESGTFPKPMTDSMIKQLTKFYDSHVNENHRLSYLPPKQTASTDTAYLLSTPNQFVNNILKVQFFVSFH